MSRVDDLCRSYSDLTYHFDPAGASQEGATAFDGRLGSFGTEAMRAHLAAFRSLAGAIEELEPEDLAGEIDRTAMLDDVRVLLFRFEHEQPHLRQPGFWLNHLYTGLHSLMVRRQPAPELAPAVLERLKAAPAFLDEARASISAPPIVFVDAALSSLGGGGELIARAAAHFASAVPGLAEQMEAAARATLEALTRFGRALGSEIAPSQDALAHAVGEEQFERRLHHEHALRGSAPELWRYGLRLLEETEAQVAQAARVLDSRRHWRDVVDGLRHEAGALDLLAAYASEVDRAREFLAAHDLVPETEVPLVVEATPPFLVPLVPFAAYMRPPLELGGPGRLLVSPQNPPASGGALGFAHLPALASHEAYPGHHLQRSLAQRLPSEVRRRISTPIMVEGWALYSETLMAEFGFYQTAETRLMQLVNLQWRAARVVLDVGLHTRGMAPAEAVERLVAAMPMERHDAESEVRRYCAMPTYQLSYAVGRREILALRDSWRAREGEDAPLRDFHASLLQYGGLPVALARWGMGLDE
ncbi:MAG TPA: DUF885 domain-containing protein [Gemmatimonadales bacterium]|nr:DUF885 domain-containing protein [Gemmatimonadales bacterium]